MKHKCSKCEGTSFNSITISIRKSIRSHELEEEDGMIDFDMTIPTHDSYEAERFMETDDLGDEVVLCEECVSCGHKVQIDWNPDGYGTIVDIGDVNVSAREISDNRYAELSKKKAELEKELDDLRKELVEVGYDKSIVMEPTSSAISRIVRTALRK